MLARIGKQLRGTAQGLSGTVISMRLEAKGIADEIREYLRKPPKKDKRTTQ